MLYAYAYAYVGLKHKTVKNGKNRPTPTFRLVGNCNLRPIYGKSGGNYPEGDITLIRAENTQNPPYNNKATPKKGHPPTPPQN